MVRTWIACALALVIGVGLLSGCKKKQAEGAAVPQVSSMQLTGPDGKPVPQGQTKPSDLEARVKGAK